MVSLTSKVTHVLSRLDGWVNTYTGLGDLTRDRRLSTSVSSIVPLAVDVLDALYTESPLAGLIVDAPVDEELRKGFEVEVSDEDPAQAIELASAITTRLEELGALEAVSRVRKWSRLYGRSAILLGADDGRPVTSPLDLAKIKSLRFLTVIDGPALTVGTRYEAPLEPKHGRPEIYRITRSEAGVATPVNTLIHESRVVLFEAPPAPARIAAKFDGFSPSILQRVHETIRACETSWDALEHMLQEASVGVLKMKGLLQAIGARGSDTAFQNRMALLDMSRSVARSLLLEPEESYERVAMQFSGVPESLDQVMHRVSAAAKVPVSVLFGRSPAGMNSTGESDLEVWRANVAAERAQLLTPKIERIVRIAMLAKDGPTRGIEPESWSVTYPPMREMSEEQEAALRKTIADTDAVYIANDVVLPEEVALSRFRSTGYSTEMRVDVAARERMLEAEIAKAEDAAASDAGAGASDGAPDASDAAEPAPSAPTASIAATVPDAPATLNGAQVASLLEILDRVARGLLPRDTAILVVSTAFGIGVDVAAKLMGDVGAGFTIEPEPEPAPAVSPPAPQEQ